MPSIEEQLRTFPQVKLRDMRSILQYTREEMREMMNRTPADWDAEFEQWRKDFRAGKTY